MNIKELQNILSSTLAIHGNIEVMINTATFPESENGTVMEAVSAKVDEVQGADDSGPVGDKYPMLIIRGAVEWHEHGSAL